ncbi:lipopolysaccharide assembly LapA domain-containing protein [Vagococcus entomophilus]|uniref:Lipopolysaccharide assembly protein A domain-containing protein n=1 Tax=Vagococcus entomophilus TaxID=1160095 RepID=A0A430AIQ1_9ENTE|nr:LapA family protein [Vagococcus entomophilus]RSU07982.1 hypothetical protein CBF30_01710 [Vagococcus entomophilus]
MKKQGRLMISFAMVVIIVIFSVINTKNVAVSFGFKEYQWPLIFIILGSAIFGALIVILTSYSSLWRKGKEVKSLKKEVKSYQNNFQTELEKNLEQTKKDLEEQLEQKEQEIRVLREQLLDHNNQDSPVE